MVDETALPDTKEPRYVLTPQERDRLLSEEKFRLRVRGELESATKQQRRRTSKEIIWNFLNSAFGLFFFGTIVVGLGTWSAGIYEKQSRLTAEQAALIQKLDAEISFRVMPLSSLFPNGSIDRIIQSELASVVFSSDPPSRHNFMTTQSRSLYPEFRDRNLSSLLIELRFMAPTARTAELLQAAQAATRMERLLKTSPRIEIILAEHVVDDVADLTPAQIGEVKNDVLPAFKFWLERQ